MNSTRPTQINEGFRDTKPAIIEWVGEARTIDPEATIGRTESSLNKFLIRTAKNAKKGGIPYQVRVAAQRSHPVNQYFVPVLSSTQLVFIFEEAGQMWLQRARFKA